MKGFDFQKLKNTTFNAVSIVLISLVGLVSFQNFRNYFLIKQNRYEYSWLFQADSVPSSWNMENKDVFMESSLFFGITQFFFAGLLIYTLFNKVKYRHLLVLILSLFVLGYEFYLLIANLP
jgi:asparagine N-glycosylation enzyme membrane subunit Stt3